MANNITINELLCRMNQNSLFFGENVLAILNMMQGSAVTLHYSNAGQFNIPVYHYDVMEVASHNCKSNTIPLPVLFQAVGILFEGDSSLRFKPELRAATYKNLLSEKFPDFSIEKIIPKKSSKKVSY